MDKESSQESLAAPTPAAGKKKHSADGVLGALKIGNILLSLIYILLAVVLVLYFGYIRYDNKAAKERADAAVAELLQYRPVAAMRGETPEGAEQLASINEDYRAWLTIDGTTIDYPVV